MKYIQVIIIGIIATVNCFGQSSYDLWTAAAGGNLVDHGNALCSDLSGNMYVTGGFQSTSMFDDNILKAQGDTDIFLAKYTKSGKLEWLASAGSDTIVSNTLSEYGTSILVDNNAIYISGVFLSKAKFDSQQIHSKGNHDIFLAKYTIDGELLWVKSAGGENQDIPYSLSSDTYGNIYVTGSFQMTAQFGSESVSALNSTEMFLAKYSPDGEVQWVRKSAGELKGIGKAVECWKGYCFVAGEFGGSISFGDSNPLVAKHEEIFLNKYTLDGNLIWSRQFGQGSQTTVEDLLLNKSGVYMTGSFTNNITFKGKGHRSNGSMDAYVAKYDNNGNPIWLNTFGSGYKDIGTTLSSTQDNQLLVGGTFQGNMKYQGVNLSSKGGDDIFIASVEADGRFGWGEAIGGPHQDQLKGMVSFEKSIVITGFFRESTQIRDRIFKSGGSSDVLLARLNLDFQARSETPEQTDRGIVVYPNPSRDYVVIKSEEALTSIEIYNLMGVLVFRKNDLNLHEYEVSLKDIASGAYIVKIFSNNKMSGHKMIINK